jgi:hypothetical protein
MQMQRIMCCLPEPTDVLRLPWDREAAIGGAAASLRSSGAFADVRLVCHDGVAVRAHQAVLAPLSTFLASLFRAQRGSCCVCGNGGGRCGGAAPAAAAEEVTLLLPWASAAAVSLLIGLFYTGEAAVSGDRERRELRAAAAALGLSLPDSVRRELHDVSRKRRAEEALARDSKRPREAPAAVARGPDGAFGCWRCGASYATERSLHAHSVLCSKTHRRITPAEEEIAPNEEIEDDGDAPPMERVTRVITEVTLEQIQVKEEPLDSDGPCRGSSIG